MATMKVYHTREVACFVITRKSDGHELSLTSVDNGLVEFDPFKTVKDHGRVYDPAKFALILAAFLAPDAE